MKDKVYSQFWYESEKGAVISNTIKGRYVITPHSFLHIVTDEYKKVAGKGAIAILYAMGFEDGLKIGHAMSDQFEIQNIKKYKKAISAFSGLVQFAVNFFLDYFKWATVLDLDMDLENMWVVIKLSDHVFTRYQEGEEESYCDWIRGWIAGLFTVLLDEDMACLETKCKTLGDEYCEFKIGKKEEIILG